VKVAFSNNEIIIIIIIIIIIDIAIQNTHNLAKTITETQNKYQELANEVGDIWKQDAVQVVPIVISATGIIPKSLSQSLKRPNLHRNTYTNAKSGNSWHMFNCKEFPKLHIRRPSLILLMKYPRIGEYFRAKAEK
jgi:hypothetical protein